MFEKIFNPALIRSKDLKPLLILIILMVMHITLISLITMSLSMKNEIKAPVSPMLVIFIITAPLLTNAVNIVLLQASVWEDRYARSDRYFLYLIYC
jgi:flagellar basal body-associated protein FliL